MKKRTKFDFSKHKLTTTEYEGVSIYKFKNPNSVNCMLVFINAGGVLTVTGDLGNWVFCREFHPSKDNHVSDGYWDEKLQMTSVQESHKFDSEKTLKAINKFVKNFKSDFGRPMNIEEKAWVQDLKHAAADKYEYVYTAYRETPSDIDYESVPFGKSRHIWLEGVYDGFDAICQLLKRVE